MAKFYGAVGYVKPVEVRPGYWQDEVYEYDHFGDVPEYISRWTTNSNSTNDDLSLNNQVSIVATPFAQHNFPYIKYIKIMDTYWKVTSVKLQYPRLLLTIGGVYNGRKKS